MKRLVALLGMTVIALFASMIMAAQAAAQPISVGGGGGENDIRGPQRVVANIAPWSRPTWCVPGANDPFDQAACKWWYWKTWGAGQTIKLVAQDRNGRDWKAVARLNGLPDSDPNLIINGFLALQAEGIPEVRRLQGRLIGEPAPTPGTPTPRKGATVADIKWALRANSPEISKDLSTLLAKYHDHVLWNKKGGNTSDQAASSIIRVTGLPEYGLKLEKQVPNLLLFNCAQALINGRNVNSCWYLPKEASVAMPPGVVYDEMLIVNGPFSPADQLSWWGK